MTAYFRPVLQPRSQVGPDAQQFAGSALWFDRIARLDRSADRDIVHVSDVPAHVLENLTAPRARIAGLDMCHPHIMGVMNATPDSFSDGGDLGVDPDLIANRASQILADGASILDIGGESTRPGADVVEADEEHTRIVPPLHAIRAGHPKAVLSLDTRKASVAQAGIAAGANIINDVSALEFDPDMAHVVADAKIPVCLMHAQGTPDIMQDAPNYSDAVLDIYDALKARIDHATAAGIARDQIILDPGIGFGKTLAHNLQLLRDVAVFHALGCPLLLGVSRKGFIGAVTGENDPQNRDPGSMAVATHLLSQGVQIIRVHDIASHKQALAMWQALTVIV